jgi:lon-related putative ATP-dependent protease
MISELPVEKLYRVCDPQAMGCNTSAEISSIGNIIGQERAVRALKFGLGIKEKGFNIFVAGMPGTGRTTAIERFLEEVAKDAPLPSDWCYVNNFRDSAHPQALRLPAGLAVEFRDDMESLTTSAVREIRNAFDSEEYPTQREETLKSFEQQKQDILAKVNEEALQAGFMLQSSPVGVLTVPTRKGKPMSEEEFLALSKAERDEIAKKQEALQNELEASIRQAKGLDKNARNALQKLDETVAQYAISHLFDEVKEKYQQQSALLTYLDQVHSNMIANQAQFRSETDEEPATLLPMANPKSAVIKNYKVNVMVDNTELKGAPVILETNPTYTNLFGRIEQEARFGALITDFTLVRGGALHRANGGYLVLPVEEVLRNPLSWDGLKHALMNKQVVIEDAGEKLGLISTKSLQPEPIPLNIKVILIGRPDIYQLLLNYDENFSELFKVKADFDTRMERTDDNICDYASFVSALCTLENLKHLDSSAIARLVEHGSRLVEDQTKLSTHFGEISDVIREASYYASLENAPYIVDAHIRKAIDERFYRSSMIREHIQKMIEQNVIKIDLQGEKVGQVNGLSVIELGDIAFGQPNRITASIGMGREGIIDIEREAQLGGPIHTKGVMILSGYLLNKYAQEKPLSLSAHLVFEQSYSGVEGDSASSTELYAILSALSGSPIHQGIAVTGSVNQKGEVQAIGGVNEKIEGFFEICQTRGLTGEQGVLIPESNVTNLMLKEEVIQAVQAGKFHIWSVKTIDEGIEVLTGIPAGEKQADGKYSEGSVNALVDQHLFDFAKRLVEFGEPKKNRKRQSHRLRGHALARRGPALN